MSDRRQRLWTCFAIKSTTHTEFEVEVEVVEDDDGKGTVGVFLGPEEVSLDRSNPMRKSNPFGDVICEIKKSIK